MVGAGPVSAQVVGRGATGCRLWPERLILLRTFRTGQSAVVQVIDALT